MALHRDWVRDVLDPLRFRDYSTGQLRLVNTALARPVADRILG